jgi:Spy/CpxP family protein refolding chaperone
VVFYVIPEMIELKIGFRRNTLNKIRVVKMNQKKSLKLIGSVMLASALTFASFGASAGMGEHHRCGGDHHKGEMGIERLDKLGNMLDLSGDQMDKIQAIMKKAREDRNEHRNDRMNMRIAMMSLNPSASNYMNKVDKLADKQAAEVKAKIHKMAKIRQQVYSILTKEQKQKLERFQARKQIEMQNKMAHHKDHDRH